MPMSEGKINFTPEQEAAIKRGDGPLLVSAAAGAGKTRVLVERLLDRIGHGDNIDEFLIITYTRAAAAELRERIRDEIFRRVESAPHDRNLRRQSMLCHGAHIDTIHGYCTGILRDNAHLAGLPPDFRVADDSESDMIKSETLKDVLDKAYETIGTADGFRALVEMMAGERDDRRILNITLDLHAKLQSDPDPRAWASKQIRRLSMDGVSDAAETVWGMWIIDKVRRTARFWRGEMTRLREEIRAFPQFESAYGESVEATVQSIEAFQAALDRNWDEARRCSLIDFPRAKPVKGYEQQKEIRKRCAAAMKKCAAYFEYSSGEYVEDMRAVAPALSAALNLALDFDRAYSDEKRRRGVVDFSDLEHLTLSMLIDSESGEKTGLAHAISRRFKEIMVDEYQDVNAIQECIFNAVSQTGKNIFMVGDVKQSIYRFRLADPSIFLGKYRSFKDAGEAEDDPDNGVKILLSKNFRSRAGILNAVNVVFSKIMSVEFGEMDYTEREYLVPGREEPDDTGPAVELDVIDTGGAEREEDEESPLKEQIEARHISQRIIDLTSGAYLIPDGSGGERRVVYSDIVILLRSVRGKAWQYATALSERGIPVDMPGGEGFLETTEVSAALSILSVVDNPMQDIPLASVLRGPAYGFTADELADIRSGSRDTDFYGALIRKAGSNAKCAAFLEDVSALRMAATDMSADRFIWHMYNKTGLLGRVGAMRGGNKRRNNLILLAEYARRFEHCGYKGLFGFLTYIRGLKERGAELAYEAAGPAQDGVRIMSIHKSKGLEFPVVILAGTTKRLNYRDIQQTLVVHPELGIGAARTDRTRRIEYPTLARIAIQSKLTSEMMAEEQRILYVAMTRAQEKLIITAAYRDAAREISKLAGLSNAGISPQVVEEIKTVAGWILLAFIGGQSALSSGDHEIGIRDSESGYIRVNIVENSGALPDGQDRDCPVPPRAGTFSSPDPALSAASPENVRQLRERFSFTYPYERATELPSKLTVTGLKGRRFDNEEVKETVFFGSSDLSGPSFSGEFKKPVFMQKGDGFTAAMRGTALHTAMQYIDYKKCGSVAGVYDEIRRLTQTGLLSEEQSPVIDARKITRFFESDTGKRVLNAEAVTREFKFSLLYPAEHFYPGGGEDTILFQGIVDCFFEENGEITVIDFKTDRVSQDTAGEKANYYAPQLAAYSDALERITGKRVKERIVYFFAPDTSISLADAAASES